jgi:drug/metabolite transporter (DMT)-like permease
VITVIAIGFFDVGANVMFGVSSTLGLLSIVAVAGSLYPVVTVILAGTVLKERLATIEKVGVALALCGVGLISLG